MSRARYLILVLALGGASLAGAQERDADDVEARLRFLESRLAAEATQARWYEGCWSLVHIGGMGFGAYQISQSSSGAALAEGIATTGKSIIGAVSLGVRPLLTARAARELDESTRAAARAQRLALAESLLLRNAAESDFRYAWQPHIVSLALNLIGGAAVWIAGDVRRAAQSAGLAIAAGELSIWTRPWGAKRDLRRYRREFDGLAFDARTRAGLVRPALRVAASGVRLDF